MFIKKEVYILQRNYKMVIEVKNLAKSFLIPHEKKSTLFEHVIGFIKGEAVFYKKFYALKNINFSVEKGEIIGIVGDNGSGKSTLLALISKILVPTAGTVTTKGKIVSFLELGVGFQEELTAKENVYLYGAVMGLTKKYIDFKFNHIIKFAGVEKFKDAKLKTFSSGMRVRLAFSTAIQTNPDILLLDEILAMGDQNFQKKCLNAIQEFKQENKTIILASHELDVIKKYCVKTLYLYQGKQVIFDRTDKVIKKYLDQ